MKHLKYLFAAALVAASFVSANAQDSTIIRAMRDELHRNAGQLHLDTLPAPYFLAYEIDDAHTLNIRATLGALVDSGMSHSRNFHVLTRLGNLTFDNGNFFTFGEGSGLVSASSEEGTTLENDYDELRRDLWLSTDAAYKTAVEDISKKKAAFENKTRPEDTIDYTSAAGFVKFYPSHSMQFNAAAWTNLARSLSSVFTQYRDIQSSRVTISIGNEEDYYVNSNGAENTRPSSSVHIGISAAAQAADGMPISDFIAYEVPMPDQLPPEETLKKAVDSMARELVALKHAPVMDEYTGPVMFTGQASAEVFGQIFSDAMCAIRPPDVDNPQMKMALRMLAPESPYQNRIGSRILPVGFTIADKPMEESINGVPAIGGDMIDDEGVPTQDVTLVDHGILKTLLACRTPHKKITATNGHGFGSPARPAITNLEITDTKGESDAQLKQTLIDQCKARELPYGILITKMQPPLMQMESAMDDASSMMFFFSSAMSGEGSKVTPPIVAYRVYPDGREELVRGAEIGGIAISDFKEMLAGGDSPFVYNTTILTKSMSSIYSGSSDKLATIAAPSVVFDELSLKKKEGPFKKPPIVPPPMIGEK